MTPTETTTILRQFNEWLRSDRYDIAAPTTREMGEAIDMAVDMIERTAKTELEIRERNDLIVRLQNELRRLAQAATPGPWKLLPVGDKSKYFAVADINFLSVLTVVDECGTSFGVVYLDGDAKFITAANPVTVIELLDRLEEARLNGMGASREAALMAKLAAAETAWKVSDKSCHDLTEKVIPNLRDQLEAAEKERDALRAKVAAMEKQEPVARIIGNVTEWVSNGDGTYSLGGCVDAFAPLPDETKLYLAPGAQPAPTALAGARKVTRDFRWDAATQCHVPTLKVEFEPVHIDAPTDAKGWQDQDRIAAMLEAAPGAQPAPSIHEDWKLVPIEPTPEMKTAGIGVEVYQASPPSTDSLTWEEAAAIYAAMISAAPEAKP